MCGGSMFGRDSILLVELRFLMRKAFKHRGQVFIDCGKMLLQHRA